MEVFRYYYQKEYKWSLKYKYNYHENEILHQTSIKTRMTDKDVLHWFSSALFGLSSGTDSELSLPLPSSHYLAELVNGFNST